MKKHHHYKYSSEHLDFVKVQRSVRKLVGKTAFYVLGFALLTIIYYIIYAAFFDTPVERGLRREHEIIATTHDTLDIKFEKVAPVVKNIKERDKKIYQAIFQTDPLASSEYGEKNRYEEFSNYNNSELVSETNIRLRSALQRAKLQSQPLDELLATIQAPNDSLQSIPAIQPIYNLNLEKTGASIGKRIHPFYKILKMHNGIDFTAATGTKVMATADGIVEEVGKARDQGLFIVINHRNGYKTVYAHLDETIARKGEKVKRGELIGRVGNSGASFVPHLHYEVWKNDVVVDPVNYFFLDLSPDDYAKMIHLASNNGQSLD